MTRFVALIGLLLAGVPAARSASLDPCRPPEGFLDAEGQLVNTAAALKHKRPLKIVVVGGSSTSGKANSTKDMAFPWRMVEELKRRHPDAAIELMVHMLTGVITVRRLDMVSGPVMKEKPTLVIWQTATADAVKGTDVEQFSLALGEGVDALLAAGSDVVLMDQQYSPMTAAMINFLPYRNQVDQVAMTRQAVIFKRHDLMRYWVEQGVFAFGEGTKEALRDEADRAHACIGRLLAELIDAKVR
jgi:hypothetical protein